MLVQITDFADNEIGLTFGTDGIEETRLCWFINEYEPILLRKAFGQDFVTAFDAGLTNDEQVWKDLRDGVIWTDSNGKTHTCTGIKEPLKRFIYFYYLRDIQTTNTVGGTTVAESANATRNMGADTLTRQWSKGSSLMDEVWCMLSHAYTSGVKVYPDYCADRCHFRPINVFTI